LGRGERREGTRTAASIRGPSVLSLFTMCIYYFDKKFKRQEKEKNGDGYF
jgi:pyruvate/2-oxoacid:ferredoxin oxidoreductase beta subunit